MAWGIGGAQLDPQIEEGEPLSFSAWVEVDLSALEHNLRLLQSRSQTPILPILKGDAYGHGAPVVASFLHSRGCSAVGVSTVEEALDILSWTKVGIMLLTPPLPSQFPAVVRHGLTPAVTCPEQVPSLNHLARLKQKTIPVQIKVDTGLGRLGVAPQGFKDLAEQIRKASHLHLGGVFTHFAAAACDRRFTRQQLACLLSLTEQLDHGSDGKDVAWHAANSAAFLTMPESHLDLVRLGTLLYGQSPLPLSQEWTLRETWRCRARIIDTRWLPAGHSVGYARAHRTCRATRIGVIPIGYAQGLELEPQAAPWRQIKQAAFRALFAKEPVHHGRLALPILGRISMGLSCLDLTGSDLQIGDTVSVQMRRTAVSRQVPRLYFLRGRLQCIFWNSRVLDPRGRCISLEGLFSAGSPRRYGFRPAAHSRSDR